MVSSHETTMDSKALNFSKMLLVRVRWMLKLFPAMSEDDMLTVVRHLPAENLVQLHDTYGINECPENCVPFVRACPKHSAWRRWHKEGLSPTDIADRWYDQTGDTPDVNSIAHSLAADVCNCPIWNRMSVCRHVKPREWYLPIKVQILVYERLEPALYLPPPHRIM